MYRGYKRYFKRTLLETSDFLKDDCLEIRCVVGVVKSHTEGPKIYSITPPPSDIGQHFGKLLESEKLTDVNFEVDGEIFSAHKLVLAARSPVFRAQLFGPLKDHNTECIKVQDMEAPVFKVLSPFHVSFSFDALYQCKCFMLCFLEEEWFFCSIFSIFQPIISKLSLDLGIVSSYSFNFNDSVSFGELGVYEMWNSSCFSTAIHQDKFCFSSLSVQLQGLLHFIYWDALPDMQEMVGLNSKWASTLMSQHLLAAADRYALDRLKLLCEAKLCEDVAINTVATTLALAEQHHCFQLKAVCLKVIALPENLRGIYVFRVLKCRLMHDAHENGCLVALH